MEKVIWKRSGVLSPNDAEERSDEGDGIRRERSQVMISNPLFAVGRGTR